VKGLHDHGNSYKGQHLIGAGLQFRDLVHYGHGRKHGRMQADMVLKKELRILHLDPESQKETVFHRQLGGGSGTHWPDLSTSPQSPASTVTHFLCKATPSPIRPQLIVSPSRGKAYLNHHILLPGLHRLVQTHEAMGDIPSVLVKILPL